MSRFTPEQKTAAVRRYLYQPEIPVKQICAELGVSHNSFRRWVQQAGYSMNRQGFSPYPADYRERAVQFYLDNPKMRTEEVCKRFDVDWTTFSKWLAERGIKHRRRYSRRYSEEEMNLAIEMYQADKRMDEILSTVGCSRNALNMWLKERGIPADRHLRRKGSRIRRADVYPEFKVRQAINMYLADKPVKLIAETVGCSTDRIFDWLAREGIPRDRAERGVGLENRRAG